MGKSVAVGSGVGAIVSVGIVVGMEVFVGSEFCAEGDEPQPEREVVKTIIAIRARKEILVEIRGSRIMAKIILRLPGFRQGNLKG